MTNNTPDTSVIEMLKKLEAHDKRKEAIDKLDSIICDYALYFSNEEIAEFPFITDKESIIQKKARDEKYQDFESRMKVKHGIQAWEELKTSPPSEADKINDLISSIQAANDMTEASKKE